MLCMIGLISFPTKRSTKNVALALPNTKPAAKNTRSQRNPNIGVTTTTVPLPLVTETGATANHHPSFLWTTTLAVFCPNLRNHAAILLNLHSPTACTNGAPRASFRRWAKRISWSSTNQPLLHLQNNHEDSRLRHRKA